MDRLASKPWILENGGRQLEAFLGSRGLRTSEIRSIEELIQTAAGVFEIPAESSCRKMADAIAAMPKSERRALARRNVGPTPSRGPQNKLKINEIVKSLAMELCVNPNDLREALRSACDRIEARRYAGTVPLSSRAASAEKAWDRRGSNLKAG